MLIFEKEILPGARDVLETKLTKRALKEAFFLVFIRQYTCPAKIEVFFSFQIIRFKWNTFFLICSCSLYNLNFTLNIDLEFLFNGIRFAKFGASADL